MPVASAPVLQRFAHALSTAKEDLEALNVAPDSLHAKIGIQRKPAKGAKIQGLWRDGYLFNSEYRGYNETMPNTARDLSASTSADSDFDVRPWTLEPCFAYAGNRALGPMLALSKLGGDAPMDAWADAMQNTLEVRAMERDRILFGDSTGTLGTVQATASSGAGSVRIKRHDVANLRYAGERGAYPNIRKGRFVVFINPATGLRIGSKAYKIRDVAQQADNGYDVIYLTSTLDADVAAGARMVPGDYNANVWRKEPNGINNIIDTGQNFESLMGVSRTDFEKAGLLAEMEFAPTTAEGVAGHLVKLMHGEFARILDIWHAATGKSMITILGRKTLLRELTWKDEIREAADGNESPSELMARANQGGGRGVALHHGGSKGFEFYHDAVQVKLVPTVQAPPGELVGIIPSNFVEYEFEGWDILDGAHEGIGGKGVRPTSNKDVVDTYWRSMENLMCTRPFESLRMKQRLTEEDVIPLT